MKKTKIWAILQAIPPKEHKALIAFVTNRVALKQANICDLLHLLLRYIAAEKDISRAETYTQIWQNTTYNDVVLRLACSDLVEKVEDFLVLQAVDMEKGERERKLSFYFLKNAEGELANQYHNKLSQEKQENTVQGTDYFYADLIDCERYFEIQELLDLRNFDVEGIDKNLDKAFTVLKLKNTARKYAAYFVNNSPFDTASIDFILKYMEENPFLHQDKLIILYRDLFFLFVKGENSLLENIKKQLTDINLRLDEISFIHILIENHIAVTWQKGAFSRQDLFDWQLFGYEKGWIYMVGGFINTVRLQNILTNYITFQKYTEALAFLNAHKTRISIGEREETYNLNIGHIYFYLGKYKQAAQLVSSISQETPFKYLLAQRILLKIYYTEQEDMLLVNALDTFQHYLYTSKRLIAAVNREGNLVFVKLLRKINQARQLNRPSRKIAAAALQKKLETGSFIAERVWLTEQINLIIA